MDSSKELEESPFLVLPSVVKKNRFSHIKLL
jgi:hypothetical protein